MPLVYKLVGSNTGNNFLEIIHDIIGEIKLKDMQQYLLSYNIKKEDLKHIRLITDGSIIKSEDEINYNVPSDENRTVYVFTQNTALKTQLSSIFIQHGTNESKKKVLKALKSDITPSAPPPYHDLRVYEDQDAVSTSDVEDELEDNLSITKEEVNKINHQVVELFHDDDFKHLIKIYYNKPHLFNILFQYMNKGSVTDFDVENFQGDFLYQSELKQLMELGIEFNKETVEKILMHFKGHMNLTLRTLLCLNSDIEESV